MRSCFDCYEPLRKGYNWDGDSDRCLSCDEAIEERENEEARQRQEEAEAQFLNLYQGER